MAAGRKFVNVLQFEADWDKALYFLSADTRDNFIHAVFSAFDKHLFTHACDRHQNGIYTVGSILQYNTEFLVFSGNGNFFVPIKNKQIGQDETPEEKTMRILKLTAKREFALEFRRDESGIITKNECKNKQPTVRPRSFDLSHAAISYKARFFVPTNSAIHIVSGTVEHVHKRNISG